VHQSPRLHAPFKFAHRLRVRFAETDAQEVVNNAAYFVYLETARIEYMRHLGILGSFNQTVAEACIQYRAPARFDDLLDCACRAVRLGTTSVRLEYMLREVAGDRLIATGHSVQVVLGPDRRPMAIPAALRTRLTKLEGADLEVA